MRAWWNACAPGLGWWLLVASPGAACEVEAPDSPVSVGSPAEVAEQLLSTESPEHLAELREERLLIRSSVGGERGSSGGGDFIQALVVFEKPPEQVFALLTQTGRQAEYLKELRSVETRERLAKGSLEEFTLKILFMNIRYQVRHCWSEEPLQIWWEIDPAYDNDLRHLQGFWQLYPYPTAQTEVGTLARYGTKIDVGPLLPDFVQRSLTKRNLPAAMRSTRDWVDGGGRAP